jgi:hypothetical protein
MKKLEKTKANPLDQIAKRIEKYVETYDSPVIHDPISNTFKTENQIKHEAEIKVQKPKKKKQTISTPMNLNLNFQKIEKQDDKTLEKLERDSNKVDPDTFRGLGVFLPRKL